MSSRPPDAAVDELLEQLSRSFRLDQRIEGGRLGDILAATIEEARVRPLPDLGEAGDRRAVRRRVEEPLTFLYRPHLFPGMDEALRLGHLVQYHLLPRELPPHASIEAAAVLESYCHLSGDMFGWQGSADGELTLWLLDVSGHGVRAGFAAVVMKLLLAEIEPGLPLIELPQRLEERFQAVRNPEDPLFLYATGVFLRIARDGRLQYVSAGHQPFFLGRVDGTVEAFEPTGMPIALIIGNPWQQGTARLREGDSLLVFSDGLVELRNETDDQFGEHRVADLLRHGGSPAAVAEALLRAAEEFHDLDRLDDDLSIVVLRYVGEP